MVEATGNCCENYVTTTRQDRLLDFGGTYVNYSDDRGQTWMQVRPLTPLVNGEGTMPPQLPLPPDLVLTDAQRLAPGQFHLRGVVRGDLDGVAGFFKRRLPESGFALGRGDAEAHEQESPFTGHGYRGSWRVVKHPGDCPVVAVFVVLIEQR